MKKLLSILLVFIFSASQVLACGPIVIQVDMCEKYTYDYRSVDQYLEYERTKTMRDQISAYFHKNIDLHQKSDFEKYLKITERVESLLDGGEYKGIYYDVLCSAYISINHYSSMAMNVSEDTVLVQELRDNNKVDLYTYSYPQKTFDLVYQNVEKVGRTSNAYISLNADVSNYSEELRGALGSITSMYEESAYPTILGYVEHDNRLILSFVANRVPEVEGEYGFIGGVGIYEQGDFTFLSVGDLAVPNGDVDTYYTRYVLDNESVIVEGNSCGYNLGVNLLKNGSDILHEIK